MIVVFEMTILFFQCFVNTMPSEDGLVTLEEIQEARKNLEESNLGVIKTPMLKHVTKMFPQLPASIDLYLKLENTQTTGTKVLKAYG